MSRKGSFMLFVLTGQMRQAVVYNCKVCIRINDTSAGPGDRELAKGTHNAGTNAGRRPKRK